MDVEMAVGKEKYGENKIWKEKGKLMGYELLMVQELQGKN